MTKPAPYPADTKAKGWRFELDLEQVRQSDTWALANAATRPWLLMLWATAWEQVPCGSLPADDALIAARMGMDLKAFTKARAVLLRGWWVADDGRLYQDTIVTRVLAMLDKRTKDAQRTANSRAKRSGAKVTHTDVTRDTQVTHAQATGEFDTKHQAPSTKHQIKHTESISTEDAHEPTEGARVCLALKPFGIRGNPSHPLLLALVQAGATPEEFVDAAPAAQGKGDPFAYLLSVVQGRRRDAAEAAKGLHKGAMPQRQPTQADLNTLAAGIAMGMYRPGDFAEGSQPETVDVDVKRISA